MLAGLFLCSPLKWLKDLNMGKSNSAGVGCLKNLLKNEFRIGSGIGRNGTQPCFIVDLCEGDPGLFQT